MASFSYVLTINFKFNFFEKTHMINNNDIDTFLNGHDPMERIVAIECSYNDERVSIIYNNKEGEKRRRLEDFKPFVWAKNSVAVRMFGGDRKKLKEEMHRYGISCKGLITSLNGEKSPQRLENGYKYIFYSTKKMSYKMFMSFFEKAGTPIYPKKSSDITQPISNTKEFLAVSPVEQYMISSGKRMFKGYDDYDQ